MCGAGVDSPFTFLRPVVSERPSAPFEFSGQAAFEALAAAIADAVVVVEADGRVAYADAELIAGLGLAEGEVVGRPLLDLVHPEAAVREEAGGFWTAPLPFEREFRVRTGDGGWTWVSARSAAADTAGQRPAALARVLGDRALLLVRRRPREAPPRAARDLLQRAFDAVDNLVVVTDARLPDNPLVLVNQNFLDTTGYAREEVLGRNCRFLQVRPDGTRDDAGDGQAEVLDVLRDATARGEAAGVVLRNYTKDGRLFYNRLYLTPLRDPAGAVTHFVGVQNDATAEVEERQRAEGQRRLLDAFFDGAPFMMGVVELAEGGLRHRAANEAALALFRASGADVEDEVEGLSLEALGVPADEAARWAAHVRTSAETGESVRFRTTTPWGGEPDAERARRLDVVVAPGGAGLFAYVVEDVTDRRAAERERRLLAAAVEQAAEAIIVTDTQIEEPGPRILYANRAHERIFGYDLEDLIGRSPRMFQGPKSDRGVLDRVRRALEAGEGVEAETVNYRADGAEFVLQWEIAPVKDAEGRVVNWVGTQRDVTERRALEAQVLEASAREQERLAREIHDGLGQVLTGAAFRLQALRQSLADLGQEALADDANRTRRIVTEAHEQARAIARGLAPVAVELDGLLVALGRLAEDAATAYGIDCTFEAEASVAVGSSERAGHLYRIVQEAIANAARHGRAKTVTVSLTGDADGATLAVDDDGRGIPNDALDASRGLGLRTMRYRADRVGGALEVRARQGGGTRVAVTFHPPD